MEILRINTRRASVDQEAGRRRPPGSLGSRMRMGQWRLQVSKSAVSPICALHWGISLSLVFLKHDRRARAGTAVAGTGAGHGCWLGLGRQRVYIFILSFLPLYSNPIAHRARPEPSQVAI